MHLNFASDSFELTCSVAALGVVASGDRLQERRSHVARPVARAASASLETE